MARIPCGCLKVNRDSGRGLHLLFNCKFEYINEGMIRIVLVCYNNHAVIMVLLLLCQLASSVKGAHSMHLQIRVCFHPIAVWATAVWATACLVEPVGVHYMYFT